MHSYAFSDEKMTALHFTLDCIPRRTATLMLATGEFANSRRIKLSDELFAHAHADRCLGELLLNEGCVKDKLRFDADAAIYRIYKASNGLWKAAMEDSDALKIIMETIHSLLSPMYALQFFRERAHPNYNRKNSFIKPRSLDVQRLIGKYSQNTKNAKDVLAFMKSSLAFKFSSDQHPHLLGCFENGVVDLTSGMLLERALPDWGMTQEIPHAYDANADTAEIQEIMQSFFPEACYPSDSVNLCKFYQGWKGYCLTGNLNLQKSLFMTGRGCNGKSILNNLDKASWGKEIYGELSMAAFSQEGSSNNDHLFQIRDTRCACIMENTASGKMCEELFKKVCLSIHVLPVKLLPFHPCLARQISGSNQSMPQIVGGDSISVQAKYKTGITQQFATKLVFMMNDSPTFTDADAFAIKRRVLNLPMRAQRLALDDYKQREELSSEGKGHYVFDKDPDLLDKLKKHHIPAYQKWCVQGALLYFKNKQALDIPKTIEASSPVNVETLMDLFQAFLKESFVYDAAETAKIPCGEIKEVFLTIDGYTDIDSKVKYAMDKMLKNRLTVPKYQSGTTVYIKTTCARWVLPSREGAKRQAAYQNIAWKSGPLAPTVNDILKAYTPSTRPPISAAPLDAEAEAEEAEAET